MKQDILDQIIKIDDNAKKNIKDLEEKNRDIDRYTHQEIIAKKTALEAKYQEKIENIKKEYDEKIKEKQKELDELTIEKLEKNKLEFEKNKNAKVEEIIKKVVDN